MVTEEDLRRRFRAIKGPESPCNLTHAQLAERFRKIFGDGGRGESVGEVKSRNVNVTSPLDDEVEAYLEAARQGDGHAGIGNDRSEWNDMDMVYQSFTDGRMVYGSTGDDDDVALLLEQAKEAVRLSAGDDLLNSHSYTNSESDEDEDTAVAHVIEASREEARLALKYETNFSGLARPRQIKKKNKKHKNKNKNKKRGQSSDSASDHSSKDCDSSGSDSSTGSSTGSSDSDRGMRTQDSAFSPSYFAKPRHESREEEYRREEAETLNRLREAVRDEGQDSDLVRILAKRLISLRKSRQVWARQKAWKVPKVMQ